MEVDLQVRALSLVTATQLRREALIELLASKSAKRGEFTLSSGRLSSLYIDARMTTMSRVLSAIPVALWAFGAVLCAQHHPKSTGEHSAPVFATGPVGSPVLKNVSGTPHTVEVTLTAEPARLSLMPGMLTDVYAYNGRVPGPTLDVREGDRVVVHFRNHLPEPTTVHWHGLHIPFASDGTPFHPIAPGSSMITCSR